MEKKGRVYKARSKTTGKEYIGQTIKNLNTRKSNHKSDAFREKAGGYNSAFYRAIRKHGWEDFEWVILEGNVKQSNLDEIEKMYIATLKTYTNGYNSDKGGNGCKGYKHTAEARKKMMGHNAGECHPFYGKSHTKETKAKMSLAGKGRKCTDEFKKKIASIVRNLGPKKGKYKGVNRNDNGKKWRSIIEYKGKKYNLGVYDIEEEAALAYNNKAIELWGNDCYLNKI